MFRMMLLVTIISNKVDRCPARYSPRATNSNQPTNRAPNEPARPISAQESIFWDKNGRFRANHPNSFGREQKFWYAHIRKPPRHLVRNVFLVRNSFKMDQKRKSFAQNDQKCQFLAKFVQARITEKWSFLRFAEEQLWGQKSFCATLRFGLD